MNNTSTQDLVKLGVLNSTKLVYPFNRPSLGVFLTNSKILSNHSKKASRPIYKQLIGTSSLQPSSPYFIEPSGGPLNQQTNLNLNLNLVQLYLCDQLTCLEETCYRVLQVKNTILQLVILLLSCHRTALLMLLASVCLGRQWDQRHAML